MLNKPAGIVVNDVQSENVEENIQSALFMILLNNPAGIVVSDVQL